MAGLGLSILILVLLTIVVGWLIAALVYFGKLKNQKPECSAVHNTPASWMFWLGLIVTIIAFGIWILLIFQLIRRRSELKELSSDIYGKTKEAFSVKQK
jgi:heme/copper-type cytochrome/quinol oxidase subunit 2